jgi:hypothetical protein
MQTDTFERNDILFRGNKFLLLTSILRERLFYISHPSISKRVECAINLQPILMHINIDTIDRFNDLAEEILSLGDFNFRNVEKNFKSYTVIFKDIEAMKFLALLFKGHEYHVLYPLYLKWLKGSAWMN